jgi:hypothetical protein
MVAVQIQLGVALSTLARLAHLDDGFGELPGGGSMQQRCPSWWIHGGVADLAAFSLFSPLCFSSFFFCCFICSKGMFQ